MATSKATQKPTSTVLPPARDRKKRQRAPTANPEAVASADEVLARELRNCSALEPVTYEEAAAIEKELARGVLETEQHVMDALTALNTEQLNFFNHRIQEVNKLYSGLAQCKTLPDAAECWTGYASTMVEEYTSHTMKVLELSTSLAASEFPGLKK